MGHGTTRCSRHPTSRGSLPWSLFYVVMILPAAGGQSVVPASSSTISSLLSSASSSSTKGSSTHSPRSTMTPHNTASPSNSTTSSWKPAPTDPPPGLFPAATYDDDQGNRRDGVFNYYFLFLAFFGILTAVFLWWIHKRRKRRKEQMRLSGQNALARDMEGWINTRRWFHGARRHNQTAAFVRREEGLNEHGEAPPPYEPKSDATVIQNPSEPRDDASGLAIPLRSLSRDDIEQALPPGYRASFSRDSNREDTQTARPQSRPIHEEPSSGV